MVLLVVLVVVLVVSVLTILRSAPCPWHKHWCSDAGTNSSNNNNNNHNNSHSNQQQQQLHHPSCRVLCCLNPSSISPRKTTK